MAKRRGGDFKWFDDKVLEKVGNFKIDRKLTVKETEVIESTKAFWINKVLFDGDEVDAEKAESGVKWLYKFCGFKEPKVWLVDSPMALQIKANELADTKGKFYSFSYESLSQSAGWTCYVDIFSKLGVVKDENFQKYKDTLLSGIFMSIFLEGQALYCRRPKTVEEHKDGSMTLRWRDGYKIEVKAEEKGSLGFHDIEKIAKEAEK